MKNWRSYRAQFMVEKILPVAIPGLEAERHLVMIKRYG